MLTDLSELDQERMNILLFLYKKSEKAYVVIQKTSCTLADLRHLSMCRLIRFTGDIAISENCTLSTTNSGNVIVEEYKSGKQKEENDLKQIRISERKLRLDKWAIVISILALVISVCVAVLK